MLQWSAHLSHPVPLVEVSSSMREKSVSAPLVTTPMKRESVSGVPPSLDLF